MNWHHILMTGGTWIAGLAIFAGGLGIGFYAIMAQYDPDVHLHRMAQVAEITGGVVLLGVLLYVIGGMVGPR